MTKASSVVASVTQQSRQRVGVSDRVQKMPEGHMSSDGTTSWWPAAERRWRLCTISETGTPSAARYRDAVYRWGSVESRWWLCTWRAQARQANGDCHASAASNRVRTSWYWSPI